MEKIGLQVYTVRDKISDYASAEATFKKVKELGYDQIQTAGTNGLTYEEYRRAADIAGLEIVGTHDSFQLMQDDFETAYHNHQILGTNIMGIGGYHFLKTEDEVREFAKTANEIGKKMFDRCGGHFTYHHHSFEFMKMDSGRTMIQALTEYLDPRYTSFVMDTFWVQHGGGDVRHYLDLLKGRIDILHMKDMAMTTLPDGKLQSVYAEIGSGNLWWEGILQAAEAAGVKYYVVEEDVCPVDSFDSIRASSEYLHKNFVK